VKTGKFSNPDNKQAIENIKNAVTQLKEFSSFRAITVNGSIFTNSGSTIVQSLACTLAIGADYMTWLTDAGLKASEISSRLTFNLAITSSYFLEIAKFRAARLLWSKIEASYDKDCKEPAYIHAETSRWNTTLYDPYVNVLRSTTEAMSAAIAVVDSLTVHPFDASYEDPTEQAERISRNTQIILQEESYLNKIVDPSAGSYYIESLTDSIASEAWKLFLVLQEKGGFVAAFKEGFVQQEIREVAKKRQQNIATRREILLGTNQFPNFNEIRKEQAKNTCCGCKPGSEDKIAEPLTPFRGAEAFESLRLTTDLSGKRPKVFMVTMGNLAMRKARATFSCNFFACAGFEVVDNNGFKTAEEGVQAAVKAGAAIVVLCSSDDEYAVLAPEVFEKLGNKAIFVVAGAPACEEELKSKGIKNFISVKTNVLEALKSYQKELHLI
jgi:methylmalonyl-CoA mutase